MQSERSELYKVIPPGATASFGGWINDANQIAGSYQDSHNVLHGFISDKNSLHQFRHAGPP